MNPIQSTSMNQSIYLWNEYELWSQRILLFSFTGWDKEEIIKYKKQAYVVMKICQVLLTTLFKDGNKLEMGSEVPLPVSFMNLVKKGGEEVGGGCINKFILNTKFEETTLISKNWSL